MRMENGDIRPALFNNGIEGMGKCIFRNTVTILISGGGGGGGEKTPEKK